jgi:Na+/melibiose symporter-like transporter
MSTVALVSIRNVNGFMSILGISLLIILILLLIGALPNWPHSHGWGYAPGSIVGVIIIILLILLLTGRI